jgi:hypothetical protein
MWFFPIFPILAQGCEPGLAFSLEEGKSIEPEKKERSEGHSLHKHEPSY